MNNGGAIYIMDRLSFFKNINGISYPEMVVDFFDHFIALKKLVNDNNCIVNVLNYGKDTIEFDVQFKDTKYLNKTLDEIAKNGNIVVIYNRTMTIHIEVLTDTDLKIKLY